MRVSRLLKQVCVIACVSLIPRVAFAHGESILVVFFWEAAVVPWAIVAFFVASSDLVDSPARNRLAALTLLCSVVAIAGGWFGIWKLSKVIEEPTPLSPLVLLIAGAPGVWYLWQQRKHQWAVALVLIPIVLAGSCGAVFISASSP